MPKTILLVDDEVFFTKKLAKNLSDSGYDVFTAFNGRDGIEVAREQTPSVAIIDLQAAGHQRTRRHKEPNELDSRR